MAPILRDGRIDALPLGTAQVANEVAMGIDLDAAVKVLSFDHEVTLTREHHEIDLRGKLVVFQEKVLQNDHIHRGMLQLEKDAIFANDAGLHRANVVIDPLLHLRRERTA